MSEALNRMHLDIAVVCSDKVYRIRNLINREPNTPLVTAIRQILDEPARRCSCTTYEDGSTIRDEYCDIHGGI